MSNIAYLAIKFGGHWSNEDNYERVLGVSLDTISANFFITDYRAGQERRIELYDKVMAFVQQYEDVHPQQLGQQMLTWPKWPAGIHMNQITPEMRAERTAIQDENKRRQESDAAQSLVWHNLRETSVKRFILALDYPAELLAEALEFPCYRCPDREAQYRVDPVQLIPNFRERKSVDVG